MAMALRSHGRGASDTGVWVGHSRHALAVEVRQGLAQGCKLLLAPGFPLVVRVALDRARAFQLVEVVHHCLELFLVALEVVAGADEVALELDLCSGLVFEILLEDRLSHLGVAHQVVEVLRGGLGRKRHLFFKLLVVGLRDLEHPDDAGTHAVRLEPTVVAAALGALLLLLVELFQRSDGAPQQLLRLLVLGNGSLRLGRLLTPDLRSLGRGFFHLVQILVQILDIVVELGQIRLHLGNSVFEFLHIGLPLLLGLRALGELRVAPGGLLLILGLLV
mmetsp:Transcript_105381/g.303084  ORF Transcript_105381/g.303084 Transcript_105381/m.303084 type:complete len:276 (-) Transcript_105381:804-1631(-)